jgi:hypothetical protein
MRDIKFRYVFKNHLGETASLVFTIEQVEGTTNFQDKVKQSVGFDFRLIGRDECIGLTDRNGEEIWENDILRSPNGAIGVVCFHEKWGSFYYKTAFGINEYGKIVRRISSVRFTNHAHKYERIGDIHSTPELLEGKESS